MSLLLNPKANSGVSLSPMIAHFDAAKHRRQKAGQRSFNSVQIADHDIGFRFAERLKKLPKARKCRTIARFSLSAALDCGEPVTSSLWCHLFNKIIYALLPVRLFTFKIEGVILPSKRKNRFKAHECLVDYEAMI